MYLMNSLLHSTLFNRGGGAVGYNVRLASERLDICIRGAKDLSR